MLQQQRNASHHHSRGSSCWPNTGPHQPDRLPHPEDLPRQPRHTGYDEPGSALELFTTSGAPSAQPSLPLVPLPSGLASCTPTCARPRFVWRSRLTRFWGPWWRRHRGRTPTRFARLAAPSSAATGCSTAAAGAGRAAITLAYRRRARFARRCCTSFMLHRCSGTSVATRRSPWRAAVRGIRAHLPDVSTRQSRPPAAVQPAVPPASPHATRRVHRPGLSRVARRPLRPRLSAGACTRRWVRRSPSAGHTVTESPVR